MSGEVRVRATDDGKYIVSYFSGDGVFGGEEKTLVAASIAEVGKAADKLMSEGKKSGDKKKSKGEMLKEWGGKCPKCSGKSCKCEIESEEEDD